MASKPEQRDAGPPGTVGFGELLRRWRANALLTQEQLADRSRLNVRTIRMFERGLGARRPQGASLRQLAAGLGLDAAEQMILVEAARGASIPVERLAPAGPAVCRTGSGSAVGTDPSMRQLPLPPPQFTGREADLAVLENVLGQAGTVSVAIDGMAGIGKTALAVHAAHRWSSRYPDGQIFLDLHAYTRDVSPVEPGDALRRLLRALGVPGVQVPDDLNDRAALYRSRLAGRRVLVLLDNAASEAQVIPLLPGAGDCLVMITSRQRMVGLDLTHTHSLDLMPLDDAVTLFVRSSGSRGARAEQPERLTEVVELCGRLPLAIRIAAARLRSRPSWTVANLVDRLRVLQHRLAELEAGDRSVTAALELSYVQLDPDLRHTYRVLGLHPGLDLDLDAAAALTGRPPKHVRRLLDRLLDAHLLHEPEPGRYQFHDLTRAHAAQATSDEVTGPDRRAALDRLLDHYCREARSAAMTVYPYEREERLGIASTTPEEPRPQDPVTVAAWVDTELANLLAVAEYAGRHGWPECTLRLSSALHRHLRVRGRYGDAAALHERALAAARSAGDRAGEIDALNDLGHIRKLQGRHEQATELFTKAQRLARGVGDQHGELNALIGLGQVHRLQSRYARAARSFGKAQRIAAVSGYRSRELEGLIGLAWVRVGQGRAAVEELERAEEIAREIRHTPGLVRALTGLGHSHRLSGRHEVAEAHVEEALEVARASGESLGEFYALEALGSIHRDCGRVEQAEELYRQALRLAREIGSGIFQFEPLHGSGRLHQAAGRHDLALVHHQQALDLALGLGQVAEQARAHDGIAHAECSLGRRERARWHWERALSILTALGLERTEDVEVTTAAIGAHLERLRQG